MIKISGPTTLTLRAESLAAILDCISKEPYNKIAGVMDEIFTQLRAQQDPELSIQPPAPQPPPADTVQ